MWYFISHMHVLTNIACTFLKDDGTIKMQIHCYDCTCHRHLSGCSTMYPSRPCPRGGAALCTPPSLSPGRCSTVQPPSLHALGEGAGHWWMLGVGRLVSHFLYVRSGEDPHSAAQLAMPPTVRLFLVNVDHITWFYL